MTSPPRSWTEAGLSAEVCEALASGLPAHEVWSLLLGVLETRAGGRTPAALRDQWKTDRFVQPCYVDQRTLNELDAHLLSAAAAFESVELSPVAPLGVCSSIALASQNKIVSTIRGTEVVSDPTNVLALECAKRLTEDASRPVRLVTSHRCVRAQAVPKQPGFAAHFRMFCLASAGHERENRDFVVGALIEHINTHLAAITRLCANGYSIDVEKVRLLASERNEAIAQRIAAGISAPVEHQRLDHAYYDGIRFMFDVRAPNGAVIPLIDGGAFDWLRKLCSNYKLVFVASGMGSQVVAYLFRRP
jgi:hypothetical protein